MPFDYTSLDAAAAGLIASFGRQVTLRRRPATPPDPNKPWEPAAVATTPGADNATVYAVQDTLTYAQRTNTVIPETASRWLVAGTGAPADIGTEWEIVDGASIYQVYQAEPIKPGGTLILWDIAAAA